MADRRVNVKLTADPSDYMAALAKAAAATEALNKKVDEAAQRVNNARRAEASAAEAVRVAELRLQSARAPGIGGSRGAEKAARALARARATLADKTYDVEAATRKLLEAQHALANAPSGRVSQETIKVVGDPAQFETAMTRIGVAADRGGHDAADKFSTAFQREFRQRKVFIAAVVAGALTAGAPLLLAGAAMLFGGIAAIAGAQSQEVRDAWTAMGREISEGSLEDAKVIIPELMEMADDLGDSFQRLRPQLRQAFEATAPLVEDFTGAVTGFAENAMPGLVRAVEDGRPVMEGFRSFMESVGTGFSDMFEAMAEHAPAAGSAFSAWGHIFGELLPLIGELLGQGAELAEIVLPPLAASLAVVLEIVEALGPLLPAVVTGFIGLKAAGGISRGVKALGTSLGFVAVSGKQATESAGKASAAIGGIGKAGLLAAAALVAFDATTAKNEERVARWAQTIARGGGEADELREKAERAREELFDLSSGDWWKSTFLLSDLWDDNAASNIVEEYDAAKVAADEYAQASGEAADAIDGVNRATGETSRELIDLPGVLRSATGGVALLGSTAGMTKEQLEEAAEKIIDFRTELQTVASAFVDPLAEYQTLLEAKSEAERKAAEETAKNTVSSSDSWQDYADTTTVTLAEVNEKLEDQIEAQANWRTNIGKIAQWAGADVAQHLAKMGQDGVDIVAMMADGGSAEAQRFAELVREDIRLGGIGWSAEMQAATFVLAEIGRQGGAATVASISAALGVGVEDVRRIAGQFGIVLAEGINPILGSLGKPLITTGGATRTDWGHNSVLPPGMFPNADGNLYEQHTAQIANAGAWRVWAEPETGGEAYIPLSPAKRSRSLAIWAETGKRLGVQNFAFGGVNDVPRPPSTAPYRPPISSAADAALAKAYGDTVDWLKKNLPGPMSGGVAGMMDALHGPFPGLQLISGFRPGSITATGNLSYHAQGRAVDVPPQMDVFEWIAQNYPSSRELIFSPANKRQIWDGRKHLYGEPTRGDHWDHVHWAMANGGIIGEPVLGRGAWSGGTYSFGERGPETVTPGVRSREFSGGTGGGSAGGTVVVDLSGAHLTGRLALDADGFVQLVDGRITARDARTNLDGRSGRL